MGGEIEVDLICRCGGKVTFSEEWSEFKCHKCEYGVGGDLSELEEARERFKTVGFWNPPDCYFHIMEGELLIVPITYWDSNKCLPDEGFPSTDAFYAVLKAAGCDEPLADSTWEVAGDPERADTVLLSSGFKKNDDFSAFLAGCDR